MERSAILSLSLLARLPFTFNEITRKDDVTAHCGEESLGGHRVALGAG